MSENEYQQRFRIGLGNIAIGVGLLGFGIGIYSIASYFSKRQLINEYITEAKAYREALMRAYEDGVIDENEQKFLNDLQNSLARKEKAIEAAGLGYELVQILRATFGVIIAYSAYKITSRLIEYWIRRYRPPKWKDPITGEEVASEQEVRERLEQRKKSDDPSKYDAIVEALEATPDWFKAMVADALGWTYEQIANIRQLWDDLPPEQKIVIGVVIAIAILLIAALAGWLAFIPEIATVFARAAAVMAV